MQNKNNLSNISVNEEDSDLDFSDLIAFFKHNYKSVILFTIIGALLGLTLAFIVPAEWEAVALLRVGNAVQKPIEPSLQMVDRLKSKSFQLSVLKQMNVDYVDDYEKTLFHKSFKPKVEKSDLISFSIRGKSSAEAKLYLDTIVNSVKAEHLKTYSPIVSRLKNDLAISSLALKQINFEAEMLKKSLATQLKLVDKKDFAQATLLASILMSNETDLRSLNYKISSLKEQLSPNVTYATDVLGKVEVSSKPVFPKVSFFMLAGALLGLMIFVLYALLKSFNTN